MARDDDDYDEDEELEALEDEEGYDDEPEGGPEEELEDEEEGEPADDLAGTDTGRLQELLGRLENNQNARLRLVEKELRESAAQRQRIERLLEERAKPAPVPEDEIPDPEVDLSGYLVKSIERLNKKADGLESLQKQEAARPKEDQELLAKYDRGEQEIQEFRAETPDYGDVVLDTAEALIGALVDGGRTQEEASEMVANRIMELRLEAMEKGLNPGAYLYANALTARTKLGIGRGKPASKAPREERPDPVKERVRRQRDRERGSRSIATLGGGRGPRGGEGIGKVDLQNMKQEDYDRIAEKISGGKRSDEATVLRELLRSKAKQFTPNRRARR